MRAEKFIELIEQGRCDKVSKNGMDLIAKRFRELQAKKLTLNVVSFSRAQEYAEFVVMCEREGRPLLLIQDYLKHY